MFLHDIRYLEKIIYRKDKQYCPQFTFNSKERDPQIKEYRIIVTTGRVKWLVSYIKPIRLRDGTNQATLVSSFDITPYRERLIHLEKQINKLRRHNEELVKQLSGAYCDIEYGKNQLVAYNKELLENNNALRVLAKNLDSIKKNTEKRLIKDIYNDIYPIISKLKDVDTKTSRTRLIDNLRYKIDELCQTLNSKSGASLRKTLTATEINVAVLIKENLRSSEIAKELKMSVATVKTHRRNIRRKLKIQNSRINLANYLKLKWHN